jgi:hypothetical protein
MKETPEAMTTLPTAAIETVAAHFKGKRRELFLGSIEVLKAAIENGAWLPKRSRPQVHKGIGKGLTSTRAILHSVGHRGTAENHELSMLISYGQALDADHVNARYPEQFRTPWNPDGSIKTIDGLSSEVVSAWDTVCRFVAAECDRLDSSRPKPVITAIGLSPKVTATLTEVGLDLDLSTITYPELEEYETLARNKKGELVTVKALRPVWPIGTVHGASRFARGSHCEACNKSIPSGSFVPMYATDRKCGKSVSMWLGRDCASAIFGIKDVGISRADAK